MIEVQSIPLNIKDPFRVVCFQKLGGMESNWFRLHIEYSKMAPVAQDNCGDVTRPQNPMPPIRKILARDLRSRIRFVANINTGALSRHQLEGRILAMSIFNIPDAPPSQWINYSKLASIPRVERKIHMA